MQFKPEEPTPDYEGIPSVGPGVYTMHVWKWRENQKTRNGVKDVVDFLGEVDGTTVGAALWLTPPGTRADGKPTRGNLFMYRKLAEALGPDALAQYREVCPFGYSNFKPTDWKDRWVTVEVGPYGIDDIREADPAVVRSLKAAEAATRAPAPAPAATAPTQDYGHKPVEDDDIPF